MIGVKPVFKDEYNKTSGIIITLKDSDIQKAKDFTNKVIKAKAKERHHKTDSKSVYKRFLTGTLGELALEELLGIKVVNWNVGKSTTFKNPDLKAPKKRVPKKPSPACEREDATAFVLKYAPDSQGGVGYHPGHQVHS